MNIIKKNTTFELCKEFAEKNNSYRIDASVIVNYVLKCYTISHDSINKDVEVRHYTVQKDKNDFSYKKLTLLIELLQECKELGDKELENIE